MFLTGSLVTLRPAIADDAERLAAIRAEPEVVRHWGALDEADTILGDDDVEVLVVEVDGEVIGAVQFSEEADPMYRHASVDIFLTTSKHGQGFGSDAIRTISPGTCSTNGGTTG